MPALGQSDQGWLFFCALRTIRRPALSWHAPPMSTRRTLSRLLLTSHVGLVLLFAALLLASAVGTLRNAVQGQARSEAEDVAGLASRNLRDGLRELNVTADILADQPTLRFYLQRGQLTKARTLLERFHRTSTVPFLRVQTRGRLLSSHGDAPPQTAPGLWFDAEGRPWRVVEREIGGVDQARLIMAEPLSSRLMVNPNDADIRLRLHPLRLKPEPTDPWRQALYRVSRSGEAETVDGLLGDAAVRLVPLREPTGQLSAVLVAEIGQPWVARRLLEWLAAFGLALLLTAVIAIAVAWYVAARIARPFTGLAQAAEQLGSGDLITPIPAPDTSLAEPLALGRSLEDMRQRVGELTAAERRQRDELDAVLDGVDEGIVSLDAKRRILYANRQFSALLGEERDSLLGRGIDEVLLPLHSDTNEQSTDTIRLAAPERFTPAGRIRPLSLRRLPASEARQIWLVRDENAAEAARGMRDRILANLSHEFQTPLSAQLAAIELLRDHLRAQGDDVATHLADAQYRGTLRLSQMVDNLLDSVRIETGEMRLRRQPLDLAVIVEEAIGLMRPLTDQRGQRIEADVAHGPALIGDAQRLFSVVVNLLANANKFAPDDSTLWVDLQWSEDAVTLWVEDEGPGLPSGTSHSDLFAPFKRSPHEEPSQRGTGLGLTIVHAIVSAHGGEVRIAAAQRRSGARLGIVLPLKESR